MARKVTLVYSPTYSESSSRLPKVQGRADLCHDLIQAYDLTPHMSVISPPKASREQILGFHSASYVDALESLCSCSDPEELRSSAAADQYGLCYDCPVEADTYDAASWICGGTIAAARSVAESSSAASIAMNWCGGWHHAKREEAAGFCYLNDVVLGILELLQTFERILYVDLDLHHGDGETAVKREGAAATGATELPIEARGCSSCFWYLLTTAGCRGFSGNDALMVCRSLQESRMHSAQREKFLRCHCTSMLRAFFQSRRGSTRSLRSSGCRVSVRRRWPSRRSQRVVQLVVGSATSLRRPGARLAATHLTPRWWRLQFRECLALLDEADCTGRWKTAVYGYPRAQVFYPVRPRLRAGRRSRQSTGHQQKQ